MKKLTLFFLMTTQLGFAQLKKGQIVPDIQLSTVLNAPVRTTTLNQLKGKLILLEFWATWCGPCLEAMPHLTQLQKQHAGQLQVITVTDETPKRIQKYLTSRPSTLWFGIDTARSLSGLFPHQMIPHTILLAADGTLIGETTPRAVTSQVIDSLWRRQVVHLPEKTDNPLSVPEVIKTYFSAADTVKRRFTMQAETKGSPSMHTTYLNDSIFKNRRLTCLNLPLTVLYRLAYGNVPYGRTIDRTDGGNAAPVYCLDLIVPDPADLWPALRSELASRFDMQTKAERQSKEVNVLKIINRDKFSRIPRNKSGKRTYTSGYGKIDQQGMTMTDFAEFIENYGERKGLVIDETQNHEKLDIKFSFQPENPQSLTDILTEMGLTLTNEPRNVDMLVLYK